MKVKLTQAYASSLKPNPDKPIWSTDAGMNNLKLYIGTNGIKSWYLYYRDAHGKKASKKLDLFSQLTVAQARERAQDIGGRIVRGENVKKEKPVNKLTYGDFLRDHYEPWVLAARKNGAETLKIIRAAFGFLMSCPLQDLSIIEIEQWCVKRKNDGVKGATLNRYLTALKASLSWGVKSGIVKENPIARLERLKETDSDTRIRYLSDEERDRLMKALDAREARIREARKRHIAWAIERKYEQMPEIDDKYADYLKPMVLLALYTGLRRQNLFLLRWEDVDSQTKTLTLRPDSTKPGKLLALPMNSVAFDVLSAWRESFPNAANNELVFPSPRSGKMFDNVKKAWEALLKDAAIENFHWHDMRHDFASQLVMAGVDLNTVRELMGHASMTMTLRYAHLAPQNKLRASEVLASKFVTEGKNERKTLPRPAEAD
jgi:integrase